MKRKSNIKEIIGEEIDDSDFCGESYRAKMILFYLLIVFIIIGSSFIFGFIVGRITAPEQLIIIKDLAPVQLP